MNLQGDLREFSVADLLRILEHGQRTGRLSLMTPQLDGQLEWQNGKLVGASLGPLLGEEAVYPWLIWPEGQFTFTEGAAPGATVTIQRPVADLLQEGLRRQEAWSGVGDLVPGWGPASRIHWLGERDAAVPLPEGGGSATELLGAAGGAGITLAQRLIGLIQAGRLGIDPTPAGALHRWFQRLAAELYAAFSAISGFKLIGEFDRHLLATIEARAWNLTWSGGKITDRIPFARSSDEQVTLYEAFLREMAGYVMPVYGVAVLRQATDRAGIPTDSLAQQLRQRWLSAMPGDSLVDARP